MPLELVVDEAASRSCQVIESWIVKRIETVTELAFEFPPIRFPLFTLSLLPVRFCLFAFSGGPLFLG